MTPRKFYDIHFHAMDLSHANLMAFVMREDLIARKLREFLDGPSKVKNLLSFMENSIRFDFLLWTTSYNRYLDNFKATRTLKGTKELFCNKNPEHFLFG